MSQTITNINVRLYNTGSVGDCILLRFFNKTDLAYSMLVDCGGWSAPTESIVACVKEIGLQTNYKLDLLVVTHQHLDHVSGFNQAKAEFEKFTVNKVWMSWIEDDEDEIGKRLRDLYGKKVKELMATTKKALRTFGDQARYKSKMLNYHSRLSLKKEIMTDTMGLLEFELGNAVGLRGAAGRLTTEDGMQFVKSMVQNVEYRLPGEVISGLDGIPGIKFFILGPPRDYDMKYFKIPTEEDEMYHVKKNATSVSEDSEEPESNGILSAGIALVEGVSPFQERFHITGKEKTSFYREYKRADMNWRQIETDWLESAAAIAMRVTTLTNNTSLAMAIQVEATGQVILLPGDAQSGNWMGWHKPDVMQALKRNGGKNTEELLQDTVLYKVGHHGSHNGTASHSGLDKMTSRDLVAMMPLVQAKVPTAWGGADNFPAKALYNKLMEKTVGRVLRVDEGVINDPKAARLRGKLSDKEKRKFKNAVTTNDLFIEYNLKV